MDSGAHTYCGKGRVVHHAAQPQSDHWLAAEAQPWPSHRTFPLVQLADQLIAAVQAAYSAVRNSGAVFESNDTHSDLGGSDTQSSNGGGPITASDSRASAGSPQPGSGRGTVLSAADLPGPGDSADEPAMASQSGGEPSMPHAGGATGSTSRAEQASSGEHSASRPGHARGGHAVRSREGSTSGAPFTPPPAEDANAASAVAIADSQHNPEALSAHLGAQAQEQSANTEAQLDQQQRQQQLSGSEQEQQPQPQPQQQEQQLQPPQEVSDSEDDTGATLSGTRMTAPPPLMTGRPAMVRLAPLELQDIYILHTLDSCPAPKQPVACLSHLQGCQVAQCLLRLAHSHTAAKSFALHAMHNCNTTACVQVTAPPTCSIDPSTGARRLPREHESWGAADAAADDLWDSAAGADDDFVMYTFSSSFVAPTSHSHRLGVAPLLPLQPPPLALPLQGAHNGAAAARDEAASDIAAITTRAMPSLDSAPGITIDVPGDAAAQAAPQQAPSRSRGSKDKDKEQDDSGMGTVQMSSSIPGEVGRSGAQAAGDAAEHATPAGDGESRAAAPPEASDRTGASGAAPADVPGGRAAGEAAAQDTVPREPLGGAVVRVGDRASNGSSSSGSRSDASAEAKDAGGDAEQAPASVAPADKTADGRTVRGAPEGDSTDSSADATASPPQGPGSTSAGAATGTSTGASTGTGFGTGAGTSASTTGTGASAAATEAATPPAVEAAPERIIQPVHIGVFAALLSLGIGFAIAVLHFSTDMGWLWASVRVLRKVSKGLAFRQLIALLMGLAFTRVIVTPATRAVRRAFARPGTWERSNEAFIIQQARLARPLPACHAPVMHQPRQTRGRLCTSQSSRTNVALLLPTTICNCHAR